MAKTTELDAAYRATTYRIFLPGCLADLRVGAASEGLRCWLETAGCQQFAIITAYNPGSSATAEARNAERQAQLEGALLANGFPVLPAQNIPDAGDWPVEESCFVGGLSSAEACALAADYGQNAVICGGPDGVPQLLWIEEDKQ